MSTLVLLLAVTASGMEPAAAGSGLVPALRQPATPWAQAGWEPAAGPRRSSAFEMDRGLSAGLACVAGALLPGMGHAIVGEYFPRGLAFTGAFFATLVGGGTFIVHSSNNPQLEGELLFGGLVLLLVMEVVYVWSVVDALLLASRPRESSWREPVYLGRD